MDLSRESQTSTNTSEVEESFNCLFLLSIRHYYFAFIISFLQLLHYLLHNFANHLVHTLSPTSFSQQSALYLRSHILVMLYVIRPNNVFFCLINSSVCTIFETVFTQFRRRQKQTSLLQIIFHNHLSQENVALMLPNS